MAAAVLIKAFMAMATMAVLTEAATATNFTVGAPGGSWDLQTNLGAWAQGKTFTKGDNLIFSYDPSSHSVLEVTKANYDSCDTSSFLSTHTDGNDIVALSSTGKRFFICGKPGHCQGGMKLEIDTVAASIPSSPGNNPSSPPPPPEKSGAGSLQANEVVGFGLGMALILAL